MKPYRQSVIRELVERESITSQELLRSRLKDRGIDATQATLSRDIRELGLVKRTSDGAYRSAGNVADPVNGGAETALAAVTADQLRHHRRGRHNPRHLPFPGRSAARRAALRRVSDRGMNAMNRILLAYSGGLDTTVAIPWLRDRYDAEIITVTVDLGQGLELATIHERALAAGAVRAHIIDARDEFVRAYILPALQAGAVYEDRYPLATALGRPLMAL